MTPRGRREPESFVPGEAKLILEHLVSAGTVKAADVHAARQAMKAEVQTLTSRLHALQSAVGAHTSAAAPAPAPRSRPSRARSRSRSRKAAPSPAPAAHTVAAPAASVTQATPATPAPRRRKRSRPLTPERQKIMQLQGRYLGLMHKVPKKEWARFKNLIPTLGKEEVVKRMEAIVNKTKK